MSLPAEDPVVRSGRREALAALVIWALALTWSVGYCYRYGYHGRVEDLTFVLWFPSWFFWGVVVPWLVCVAASPLFAFGFMGNEPLGEEAAEADSLVNPGESPDA